MKKSTAIIGMVFAVSAVWAGIITDDFNRADTALSTDTSLIGANWVNAGNAASQWAINSGEVVGDLAAPGILINSEANVGTDDLFEVSATMTVTVDGRWVGLVLNYQDPLNYYEIRVRGGLAAAQAVKVVNGVAATISGSMGFASAMALNTPYTMTVRGTSDTDFYVDFVGAGISTLNAHYADSGDVFSGGKLGMIAEINGAGLARFDNFSAESSVIPEPATFGLGLVSLGILFIRKRFII